MEIWKGRPDITPGDHPTTILKALRASHGVWPKEHTDEQALYWHKQALDASGALQDGFGIIDESMEPLRPDGSARLYMSVNDLEYAVVGYGLELLKSDVNEATIAEVDAILHAIDKALHRK